MSDALSFTGARWTLQAADPDLVRRLATSGLRDATARCLAVRGGESPRRLDPPTLADLHDPYAMHHMGEAVDRLRKAARDRQRVRIITDYDVDGTTSSLILQATLRLIAPEVVLDYHIPDRFVDGYGFSVAAAGKAADDGIDLLVTADIGVRDHASVARARESGVDVLICDHHLPAGASVPDEAIVLCPPQLACSYPNRALAACGVSTKLAQAMLAGHPKADAILRSLLKLAAIGTIADLVPLNTPENRAIVALGLQELNGGRHHPGLQALLDLCRLDAGPITETDLAFRVAPRINAAGRIAQATHVVDLLTTPDPMRARQLARQLEELNQERRQVQHALVDQALAAAADVEHPFIVVSGREEDGWHRGVIGIVAARLKDEMHRPCAVVSIQGDLAVGSVRSVAGVHAVQALESASDLLLRFGGHPAAAGFSLPAADLPALQARLTAWMEAHTEEAILVPEREVDAVLRPDELDDALLHDLTRLAPFGMGNPEPRLMVRAPRPGGLRRMGKQQQHLRWELSRPGGASVEIVWWSRADLADQLLQGPVELLGKLEHSSFHGQRSLRFVVTDARPATTPSPGSLAR